jgi:hypothetical protein
MTVPHDIRAKQASLASPGLLHLVESSLQSPATHAPAEWSVSERAMWIMGFEHAMTMVQDYINGVSTKVLEARSGV